MINLLNPDSTKELRAGRVNIRLRRYTILTFLTVGIIGAIYAFSYKIADEQLSKETTNNATIDAALASYAPTKKAASEYQSNLAVAQKILGSQIVFSSFITDLSAALPPRTILDSFSLSTKSMTTTGGKPTAVQITARGKSYDDILMLKSSLEKKTRLFSSVRITSSTRSPEGSDDNKARDYPYVTTFSVVIAPPGAK